MTKKLSAVFVIAAALACDRPYAVPYGVPAPPETVRGTSGAGRATIDWDLVPGAVSYRLYFASDPSVAPGNVLSLPDGGFAPQAKPGHFVLGLDGAKTYWFVVTSENPEGEGPPSPAVSVRPAPQGIAGFPPSSAPARVYTSGEAQGGLGTAVGAGDFNGDGFSDLAVISRGTDDGGVDFGKIDVFKGGTTGLPAASSQTIPGTQGDAFTLSSVATGDIDGDGFDDLVVGRPNWPDSATATGAVFLFAGSATGLQAAPVWQIIGEQSGASLGQDVAVGDFNHDGRDDIVAGAPGFDDLATDEGRAFAWLGTPTVPATNPDFTTDGNQGGARLGIGVAAGDVNGDGFDDLVVGASGFDGAALIDRGKIDIFAGRASGVTATSALTIEGQLANMQFGHAVAIVGDVDADGFDDIVVGAPAYTNVQANEGRVELYLGGNGGPSTFFNWAFEPNLPNAFLGMEVEAAGDVNGDGRSDLVLGAPLQSSPITNEGAVYVFLGDDFPYFDAAPNFFQASASNGAAFGFSVTGGDFDGDDSADVAAGAPLFDGGALVDEGRALVFLGAPSTGARVDAGRPIATRVGQNTLLDGGTFVPAAVTHTYRCDIDWGDGSHITGAPLIDPCTPLEVATLSRAFEVPGTFAVRLTVFDPGGSYSESVTLARVK